MDNNDRIPDDHFKCDNCGGVFEKGWSQEEADKEMLKNIGVNPRPDDAILCDTCYAKFMAWFTILKQ
jgi:hypothetical protein